MFVYTVYYNEYQNNNKLNKRGLFINVTRNSFFAIYEQNMKQMKHERYMKQKQRERKMATVKKDRLCCLRCYYASDVL